MRAPIPRPHDDRPPDAGSVSLFFAVMFVAALLFAGLVADVGGELNANAQASDAAAKAARFGAQELDPASLRAGEPRLDEAAAARAATAHLARRNLDGHVRVSPRRVTVTVSWQVRFRFLARLRGGATVTQTRSAEPVAGPQDQP
jgi:hypothetical protein